MTLPIAIVAGVAIFVALIYVGLKEDRSRDPLQERLALYGERELPSSLEEIELSLSFKDRILLPLARGIADLTIRFTPEKQLEDARRLIDLAGMTLAPASFFAMRIGMTLVFVFMAVMVFFVLSKQPPTTGLLYTAGAGLLGYFFLALHLRSEREPLVRMGLFSNRPMIAWGAATVLFALLATSLPVRNVFSDRAV